MPRRDNRLGERREIMKTISRVFISLLIVSLLAAGITGARSAFAAPAKITLTMAGSLPAPHSASKAVVRFADAVKKHTDGQVEIKFFPGSSLYADKDIPTAITQGACDMALTSFGTWGGISPSVIALDLVGVYRDFAHYNAAQDGSLGKLLAQDLAAKGVHLVGFAALGETQTISTCKKLIQKPEDLKGLLIRCPTMGAQWFVEAFGAVPSFISSAELYSALQRGTVDGAAATAHSARQSKWYEAAPNITWVMICPGAPFGIVANLSKWSNLPPKIQETMSKDWAAELADNRKEARQQQDDAWKFFTGESRKVKTYMVTDEVRRRDWDPIAYEFELKKLYEMLGKEKTDKILKAIADSK